jgi:hypothetical protein
MGLLADFDVVPSESDSFLQRDEELNHHQRGHVIRRTVSFDGPTLIDKKTGGVVGTFKSNPLRANIRRLKPKQGSPAADLAKVNEAAQRLLSEPDLENFHLGSAASNVGHDVHTGPGGVLITDAIAPTTPLRDMVAEGTANKIVNGEVRNLIEVATVQTSTSVESQFLSVETAKNTLNTHKSPLAQLNPLYDRVSKIFSKISKYPQQFIDDLFIGSKENRLSNIPNYHESISPHTKSFNLGHLGEGIVEELSQDAFGHEKHLLDSSKGNLAQALNNFGHQLARTNPIFKVGEHGLSVEDGRVGVVRTTFENYFETKRGADHFGNYIRTTIFRVNAELGDGTLPVGEIQLVEILQSPMIEVMFPDGDRGIMPDVRSLKRVMGRFIISQAGL